MTDLLEQAIAAIEKLPEDIQNAIAARLLAELADEKAWLERFESTTDAQWDRMAEMVRLMAGSKSSIQVTPGGEKACVLLNFKPGSKTE